MKRIYCKPDQLKEYVDFYASINANWERFHNILVLDFNPAFIKANETDIRIAYNFKRELQQLRNVKYSTAC